MSKSICYDCRHFNPISTGVYECRRYSGMRGVRLRECDGFEPDGAVSRVDVAKEVAADSTDAQNRQVGGDHYVRHAIQPWDIIREYGLNFWEGNALKYLLRRKGKRLEDLEKARHYIDYLIERERSEARV